MQGLMFINTRKKRGQMTLSDVDSAKIKKIRVKNSRFATQGLGWETKFSGGISMKHTKLFALPVLAIGLLVLGAIAFAQGGDSNNYKLLTTISIPNLVGFDISWVDSVAGRYYLANRGTGTSPATPNITVIDTEHL